MNRLASISLVLLVWASPATLGAQSSLECLEAHGSAQEERLNGRLMQTRELLRTCSASACPTVVRGDCLRWLTEVQPMIPMVRFLAELDGEALSGVEVVLDGEPVSPEALRDGMEVNPGLHRVRFIAPDLPPRETEVVARQGERGLVVHVRFESPRPDIPDPREVRPPGDPAVEAPAQGGVAIGTWVLGGVAVASAVVFATLGTYVLVERDSARTACAPFCDRNVVSRLRTTQIAADVMLGVGVGAAIAAVIYQLVSPEAPSAASQAWLAPMVVADGAGLLVGGSL